MSSASNADGARTQIRQRRPGLAGHERHGAATVRRGQHQRANVAATHCHRKDQCTHMATITRPPPIPHTHTHTHTHHHSLLLRLPPIHSRLPNVAPAPPALTIFTCCEFRSASLKTATVLMPSFFAVRITRHAISPLFATSTLSSSGASLDAMRARGRIRELRAKSDIMWARIS